LWGGGRPHVDAGPGHWPRMFALRPPLTPPSRQMVKPLERNTRYVDAVMTVPKGVLYPMVRAGV
jgi:hypothetical protein